MQCRFVDPFDGDTQCTSVAHVHLDTDADLWPVSLQGEQCARHAGFIVQRFPSLARAGAVMSVRTLGEVPVPTPEPSAPVEGSERGGNRRGKRSKK